MTVLAASFASRTTKANAERREHWTRSAMVKVRFRYKVPSKINLVWLFIARRSSDRVREG